MLKKFVAIMLAVAALPAIAAEESISLPEPELQGGKPLMEAITARKTSREFSAKRIEPQDLSNILYAVWGISHDDKRTIPTARNLQKMNVYAVVDGGIWRYDGKQNILIRTGEAEDIIPALAKQDFVLEAPLTLIFTGEPDDHDYMAMHAGSAYQNVALYCASRGLNNVVRGLIDYEKAGEVLGLEGEKVIITQTIGWPYM